jgi:hypothetical protein
MAVSLDTLEGFKTVFPSFARNALSKADQGGTFDGMYCARCGGSRRMTVKPIHYSPETRVVASLTCVQCVARWLGVYFVREDKTEGLAMLPTFEGGGIATPNTPATVAHYLAEAHRCQSVGASSAVVAMYRAAIEQILFEAGFKEKMLGPKLAALEAAIKARTAPKWALDLETEYLVAIKDLGNGSIHGGDAAKQAQFDADLAAAVAAAVGGILFHIYEAPALKATHLAGLQQRAKLVKK